LYCKIYSNAKGTCRGFANITFSEKTSYLNALNASIYFESKHLNIEPYVVDAKELAQKDEILQKHRVCVLNIPSNLINRELEIIFSKHFGQISNAYIKPVVSRYTNIGFVTFVNEQDCQKALSTHALKINDQVTLIIKKFTGKKTHQIEYNNIVLNKFEKKQKTKNFQGSQIIDDIYLDQDIHMS
jgi:RNA recognition motif-containing protein